MAKLPDETLIAIFRLQQRLLERLDDTTATETQLLDRFGENEATLTELEELQNLKERLNRYYSGIHTSLRLIYEAQPRAASANLEILQRIINDTSVALDAALASIQEIQRNWSLS